MDIPKEFVVDFWKDCGKDLLLHLKGEHVPIDLRGDILPKGVPFSKIRYSKDSDGSNGGENWVTERQGKREGHISCSCKWIFVPQGIVPKGKSVAPEDQVYVYLMNVVVTDDRHHKEQETERILTTYNGTRLDHTRSPKKLTTFPYPQIMVGKINKCLASYFWSDLWLGRNYFAWYKRKNNRMTYMGTRGYQCQSADWIIFLKKLLDADTSGTVMILLALTFFSVLKPFFPEYPQLSKFTPYLKAKKKIGKQIAVNIRSDKQKDAEDVVRACCGCFAVDRKKGMVIDGIAIKQSSQVRLSAHQYERDILQPACVLWINRKPETELTESGKVIDLWLPSKIPVEAGERLSMDMVATLAEKMEEACEGSWKRVIEMDWKAAESEIRRTFLKIDKILKRYQYQFADDDLNIVVENCLSDWENRYVLPEKTLDDIWDYVLQDTAEYRKEIEKGLIHSSRERMLDKLEEEADECIEACRAVLRKKHRENIRGYYSLHDTFLSELKRLTDNGLYAGLDVELLRKMAFLAASIQVFITVAVPEQDGKWIRKRLELALEQQFAKAQVPWRAVDLVEKYISDAIKQGGYARIRGEGSGRADIKVWYDPRKNLFLLPPKICFDGIVSCNPKLPLMYRKFARQLGKEGCICVQEKANQKCWEFEAVLTGNGKKVSVWKVRAESFSERFFSSDAVRKALEAMASDPTPFRSKLPTQVSGEQ